MLTGQGNELMTSLAKCFFTVAALVFFLLLPGTGAAAPAKTTAWVIRYDIDSPQEADSVCRAAGSAGFDTLLVQVRGRGDAFYRSSIAPRAESLSEAPADFDPLAAVLSACAPIPVQAWLNVYYLWGAPAPPANRDHPGHPGQPWILHDINGRPVSDYTDLDKGRGWIEGTYADPASEAYRALLKRVAAELVTQYPVTGIHLDFIRYPGWGYGQTGPLGERFRKRFGFDPRLLPERITRQDLYGWIDGTLPPADRLLVTAALFWADMRAAEVTAMVRAVRDSIDRVNPALTLSAAVFPDAGDAYLVKGQDWPSWAAAGLVDALYPMAYFGDPARVGAQLAQVAHTAFRSRPGKLWAGLGAYIKGPEQIAAEAAAARRLGYDGIALFSLGHLLAQHRDVEEYVDAIGGEIGDRFHRPVSAPPLSPQQNFPQKPARSDAAWLQRAFTKALGGHVPQNPQFAPLLARRLDEFNSSLATVVGAVPQELTKPVITPQWVELQGFFRFAHRFDSPDRWEEQHRACELARQRVENGEEFAVVAREISQGGTRLQGGELGRRYLNLRDPTDRMLATLPVGALSPVIKSENGFWVYRIRDRGGAGPEKWSATPWPARRLLFRNMVKERIAKIAGQPGSARRLHQKGLPPHQ